MFDYLSTFSGVGGFELGITRACPEARCVGHSEIDQYALKVYESRFGGHQHLGDVNDIRHWSPPTIASPDLLVGGPPCQDLSQGNFARKGLIGDRSGLFYAFLDVLCNARARDYVMENVASMPDEDRAEISKYLGEPIELDSAHVSGQSRKRLFWCSFPVAPLEGDGPNFKDCLDRGPYLKDYGHTPEAIAYINRSRDARRGFNDTDKPKCKALVANLQRGVPYNALLDRRFDPPLWRKFTPTELERLQTFPGGWTAGVSYTQRCRLIGNAVTADVIAHIIRCYTEVRFGDTGTQPADRS